jgi:hypothetical protein
MKWLITVGLIIIGFCWFFSWVKIKAAKARRLEDREIMLARLREGPR